MRTAFRSLPGSLLGILILGLVAGSVRLLIAGSAGLEHQLTLAVPGRSNATPSIAADGRFIAITWGATTSEGKTDVFIATSRNGGWTFGSPIQVNTEAGEARLSGEMPPRVAILKTASYGGPDVVVLWTARGATTEIKMARSPNGGRAFEPPITLQSTAAAGDRGWPALTIDDHGSAHAIWLDHRGLAGAGAAGGMSGAAGHHHAGAAAGTAAGSTTSSGSTAGSTPSSGSAAGAAPRDPVAVAQKSALHYASLAIEPPPDTPATPVVDRELAKGVCYCCKTSLIAGRDGALFAAWRHVYPGSMRDIAFSQSRDGGKTFSAPAPISHDDWAIDACPDDGPALAVDASQTVHIVWPTVIDATSDEPRGALFYTSTRDGRTFAARTRIPTLGSTKASHPQIAIDHAGRLFVAWDESISGKRVAAVREIKPGTSAGASGGPSAPTFGPVITLTGDGPGQYPVLASTSDNLIAAWTTAAATASSFSSITVVRAQTGDAAASVR